MASWNGMGGWSLRRPQLAADLHEEVAIRLASRSGANSPSPPEVRRAVVDVLGLGVLATIRREVRRPYRRALVVCWQQWSGDFVRFGIASPERAARTGLAGCRWLRLRPSRSRDVAHLLADACRWWPSAAASLVAGHLQPTA